MAVAGGMDSSVAMQFVQYSNDAVDVYYSDGSRLQLSACGSAFRYYHPPYAGQHPLHGQKEIQQRTEFVTSEFQCKVQDALEFRNRFAQRPYLCRNLTSKNHLVCLHADIEEVAWPESTGDAEVISYPDGSVRLVSADEYAALTLPGHRQYFTTEILCKISQRKKRETSHSYRSAVGGALPSPINSAPTSHNASRTMDETTLSQKVTHINYDTTHTSLPENSAPSTQPPHDPLSETIETAQLITGSESTGEGKWEYVWISQHQSLHDIPTSWKHPLQILLHFVEEHKNDVTFIEPSQSKPNDVATSSSKDLDPEKPRTDEPETHTHRDDNLSCGSLSESLSTIFSTSRINESRMRESAVSSTERRAVTLQRLLKKDFAGCVFIPSPSSLPLSCPSLHLHRWRPEVIANDDNEGAEAAYMYGKVKVICAQGVIYRLVWKNPRSVEIYPGDGSIMRSTGLSGHFFSHYLRRPNQVVERTYSVQSPPPTPPGAPYSIAKLISRAARFLQHLCEESLQSLLHDDPCCWAVNPTDSRPVEPLPTVTLEECTVDGIGHFSAYSNGHIRILFSDRTSLEMSFDFAKRVLGDVCNCDSETLKRYLRRPKPLHLAPGVARLLLRSGQYHQVHINQPGEYESYIKAAIQWAEWVNSSPSERYVFYKDTIYDQRKQRSVDSELKKIECFNCILTFILHKDIVENMVMPQNRSSVTNPPHPIAKTPSTIDNSGEPGVSPQENEPCLADLGYDVAQVPRNRSVRPDANISMSSIQDVLRKTAAAVADLDHFMKSSINYKPPR